MADLGNLKILLDMATTGNLKSTLENVDKRLDKMREKAASLQLGFDDKSVSALSTKMRDIADSMQEVSRNAGTKMADGMAKSAEATKSTTTQMQQQVALSADLEALFKEMAGTIRTIAEGHEKVSSAKRTTVTATKEEAAEEQKLYDITRLRQIAEEKKGQLTQDQVSVLKQMETIEKALVAIDEKYATNLAKELQTRMHYDGVTKAQLGTYQSLITRMQAAMQVEQKVAREAEKANRQQKQAAKEREAAAKRQAQLETTIIRIETQLLGINEARLSSEAQLLVQKMRNQQITQEEASRLSAILTQHRAIVNAEKQKGEAAAKTNAHLGRQSGLLQQITSYLGTYFSVMGAASLIKNLVRITGEFEAQHVALRAILQDVAGADRIFYQLQELAVKSPFTFRNLTDYAKQLSAFSVPMNEIYDTTKRLADVSAGLGVDMSRIILAYGQIRSASFLRGQEVRQLTEAGIPVLQELAKQFSEIEGRMISAGEVFERISARQVPFEMIQKMFNDLTSAGGKFYQMQETLAETVKGKVSNLQDAWEIMLSKIGDTNSGAIKNFISVLTDMLSNYETLIPALKAVVAAMVTISTVTGAVNTIQKIRIALIKEETRALLLQKVAVGAVAGAIGLAVGVVTYFVQKQKQAREEANELSNSLDRLSHDFRNTFSTFAVSWRNMEKAYETFSAERHNAYKRALNENEGLLPDISESAKKLISDTNKVIGPIETLKQKTKDVRDALLLPGMSSVSDSLINSTNSPVETIKRAVQEVSIYGGELDAAIVTADKNVKQLVSDGGELEAAIISVNKRTKQLVSDGGELNASMITAERKIKQLVSNGGELEASLVVAHRRVKQLVSDGGELEAAIVSLDKKTDALVADGGELNAAIVVADRKIKQLVSDGGELEAAIVTVDRNVKQLVSDGGELEAAVVTAAGKTLPKLNAELTGTVKATKELGLVGEPVRKSQKDIEKQFNASKQSTDEYKKALNELYEKYPNFIDENVRQKIAVEDLAGAWDIATQNMRQYYAENATQQAHTILQKNYDESTNKIIDNINAKLRTGKEFQQLRDEGLINEGSIQLIDAYMMGLKTREDLDSDMQDLITRLNKVGQTTVTRGNATGHGFHFETVGGKLIDNARKEYQTASNAFRDAIAAADKTIEADLTSSRHKKVMEYLLGAGLQIDSELMMRNDEKGFETWEQWQERLRNMYKDTTDENAKAIEGVFSHFGLAVNPNELTPVQKSVSDWMKQHPVHSGVSLPGLEVKPETNISEFAENALKMMREDEKELARLPKEFQKENEEQTWEEYAQVLEDAGNTAHAAIARRRQYLLDMSEGLWGDDVFGSTKELAKKKKKEDQDYQKFLREQLENLRQQFQNLKEIKTKYDELTQKVGLSETEASKFLSTFHMAVPVEGFNAAFDNLSAQFIKYGDKNTAQDVQNFKNGRDVKSDIDSMIASAKAVEKYTEALKDLEAQTRRLNLSGFAQELDKIIVDADSKNRQLETNWAQKAEELEKAKDGWIQRYRVENEKATAEDAEKAWKAFYDKQVDMAKKSIDTQREYNNKVAQKQINDKASKWLEEMMKENNINLNDMGDKSIGQMDVIISRLRSLVTSDALANLIPEELKSDAELLNVTFEELLVNIERIVNTKVGDVQVDRMKKLLSGLSSGLKTLGITADMGAVQDAYAKYVEKMREEEQAQKDLDKATVDAAVNRNNQLEYMEKAARAAERLRQAQSEAGESLKELKWSAALVGVQAFASALDNLGASIAKIGDAKGDESLKGLGDAISSASKALENAAGAAIAGFLIGGPAGAAIGAGLSMLASAISSVLDAVAEAEAYTRKMTAESDRWALAVSRVRNEYALLQEQFDTIFGESNISKMAGWMNLISEQSKILRGFNGGGVVDYANSLANKNNLSVSDIEALVAKMQNSAQGLANTSIKVVDRIFGVWDEYKSVAELVPQLFNEDGSLNFDYLDEFKNTEWYNQLSDEWKRTLDKMEEANETYMDAVGKMKDYLTSVFGEVGATITEQMISKFEETGEVAMDTGDILSNVAKKFVSDWTQAFLVKNYLQDLGDSINDIWMDSTLDMDEQVSQSLGLLRDAMTAMSDRLPEIQKFYEGIEDQYHWAEGAGEEIGDAIKTAMVEQNSSLIAGYINSMRADLSMQRNEIMRSISPAVTSISNGFNTHLQYMESVAGNVANIWNRLNLLTSSGSGVKINTRI